MVVEEKVVSKLEGNRVSGRAKDTAVANMEVKERKLIRFDQQGHTHYVSIVQQKPPIPR